MKKSIAILAFLMATGLVFTACNNNQIKNNQEENIGHKAPELVDNAGSQLPNLIFQNADGEIIALQSLKGKVVFMNFWATWCSPCKFEIPSINKLKNRFESNNEIVFLMVDVDAKLKQSKAYLEKNGYDLMVYAAKGKIPSNLLGNAIPTTIIFDKEGKIVAKEVGAKDYSSPQIVKLIKGLLGE